MTRFAKTLLTLAALLLLGFLLLRLCGWRQHAATLLAGSGSQQDALRGALFIGAHLASVLLVPALAVAALLHSLANHLLARAEARSATPSSMSST